MKDLFNYSLLYFWKSHNNSVSYVYSPNLNPMRRPDQGDTRYFHTLHHPIQAYLLGFIAADGCLIRSGNSRGLTITIHTKDVIILEKLRSEIGCENKIQVIRGRHTHDPSKEKDHRRFQLFNKELYSDLQSYGLTERKSTTMPDIISTLPEIHRAPFLIGYLDGDGSVSYNISSKQLVISFRGTEAFLQGLAWHLRLPKYRLIKDKQRNCWTLSYWRKGDAVRIYNMYKELDFYLSRKYDRICNFLKISKDETISPPQVHNLEVSGIRG